MNATDGTKKAMAILVATSEPDIQVAIAALVGHALGEEVEIRFTFKAHESEVRTAATLYEFDLVLLCVNTLDYSRTGAGRFDNALELIRELKQANGVAMLLLSTYYPKGFATAAEQLGVEATLDMPYTVAGLTEQIRSALTLNAQMKLDAAMANSARRRRTNLRPRVVIVDDSPQVLELVSSVVWSCWTKATVVACTGPEAALADVMRVTPDLLITDLECGSVGEPQLLSWLAGQAVKYPIVVLSDELLEEKHDDPGMGGRKLRVSYWPKRFNCAELAETLNSLLD